MPHGGNVNIMTVMGDARMDGLSDAGSTPARSTITITALCMKDSIHDAVIFLYQSMQEKLPVAGSYISPYVQKQLESIKIYAIK